MSHTTWSVGRTGVALLLFALLPLPLTAAYMASPADLRCEHAEGFVNCTVTDRWLLAESGRLVAVRAPERAEVVKKQLVWKTPGGDVEVPVPRSNEIADADLAAAAEKMTALAGDPSAGPLSLSLYVPRPAAAMMALLALVFYGLVFWGAGRNAMFTAANEKLVVRRRWFSLVRSTVELPRSAISDVQLTQVRSLYRLDLILNDGSRVFACTVSYGRGKAEAETVRQLVRRGA